MSEGNEQSRRSAEDLQDLYENAPCGYISIKSDGRISKANATLATWTGYSQEQLVGMRFRDLLTVGTALLYETSFVPLLNMHGYVDEVSFDIHTTADKVLAVFASAVRNDFGPSSTRMILMRAAERRRYEHQLVEERELSQRLEGVTKALLASEREASLLREQFIAVLGHDLRNPLASILGGAQLLDKNPTAERQKLLLKMIKDSAVRMAGLIDNVLDFARGRLGAGIPLSLKPEIELRTLLEQVISELRISFPDKAIETSFQLRSPVRCDASRIGQMVSNLVANALTHGSSTEPVRVHADDGENALVIWVANGGPAIPGVAIEKLFQPFFRGEVRASQQGLGLGLHIASEIAKAHEGTLTVESSDNETRFTFRMSLDRAVSLQE